MINLILKFKLLIHSTNTGNALLVFLVKLFMQLQLLFVSKIWYLFTSTFQTIKKYNKHFYDILYLLWLIYFVTFIENTIADLTSFPNIFSLL